MHSYQNVFDHGHAAEKADVLKRSGDAAFCNLVRTKTDQRLFFEGDLALFRTVDPCQGIEESCFARAIRSDNAGDLSLFQLKVHLVDGGKPTKSFNDVCCL